MNTMKAISTDPVLKNLDRLIPDVEALYKDVHAHPELSMRESSSAASWRESARPALLVCSAMAWVAGHSCAPTIKGIHKLR